MQKLDDILLRKGDIVAYCTNIYNYNFSTIIDDETTAKHFQEILECKIIKVQHPIKFEIIYEAPKPILNKEEIEYLEAVLKPFRNKIKCVVKFSCVNDEFISVMFNDRDDVFEFPLFKKDTMYKGMQLNKEYTLEELGLLEE